jgi:hypothetical protein
VNSGAVISLSKLCRTFAGQATHLAFTRVWLGEYGLIAMHSRALSEAEIAHNFSLDSQSWK